MIYLVHRRLSGKGKAYLSPRRHTHGSAQDRLGEWREDGDASEDRSIINHIICSSFLSFVVLRIAAFWISPKPLTKPSAPPPAPTTSPFRLFWLPDFFLRCVFYFSCSLDIFCVQLSIANHLHHLSMSTHSVRSSGLSPSPQLGRPRAFRSVFAASTATDRY